MVLTFQNSFFSAAGQKERLSNVANTLLSAVGLKKGGVQSNTGIKPVDAVLSAAASHPFITAGVATAAIAPAATTQTAKNIGSYVAKEFSQASLGTKAAVIVAAPIAAGALASSSRLRSEVVNAPSSLSNFGANVGDLVDNPSLSNLSKVVKENPVISGAVGLGALGAVGASVAGVASTIATRQNTKAILENTANSGSPATMSNLTSTFPTSVAGTQNLVAPATDSRVSAPILSQRSANTSRRRRKPKSSPSVSQNVRINITDDRDVNDRKKYK